MRRFFKSENSDVEFVISEFVYFMLTSKSIAGSWENAVQGKHPSEDKPYYNEYMAGYNWFLDEAEKEELYEVFEGDSKLHAYFIRNPIKSNKVAIVNHGYRTLSKKVGPCAKIFFDAGYNILAPSFRSSSLSEGHSDVSFGYYESEDNIIWLDRMLKEFGQESQIIFHGLSMGASTDMLVMGKKLPRNVKAVIADCGYSDIRTVLYTTLKGIMAALPLPEGSLNIDKLMGYINEKFKIRQGISIDEISPISAIKDAEVPLLILAGDADVIVPVAMSDAIITAAPEGSKLVMFSGAEHSQALATNYPLYKNSILDFLKATVK